MVRGEQERTRARAGPENRGGARARERKRVAGHLGEQSDKPRALGGKASAESAWGQSDVPRAIGGKASAESAWGQSGCRGCLGAKQRRGCLGAKRAPGCSRGTRSAGAAGSCERRVREVVGERGRCVLGAGRVGMQVRARMLARLNARQGGRRGRAHLSPEEMRTVVEAASPMRTCSFLVRSFCRVRGFRTDACASGLGAGCAGWGVGGAG
jgi:hypothetical protein